MKRYGIIAALACALVLFVGAHRPPVGVGSGIGVTAQVGRAGSGVGVGSAYWDTFTVVFSTKAATAAQYPESATSLDSAYVQAFDAAVASADTFHQMGTGQEVSAFAWGVITEADTNGYYNNQYSAMNGSVRVLVGGVSHLDQRTQTVANNRYMPLTYIPFEKYIPSKATIVDATMMTSNYNNAQYTYGDTIVSVLLDRPGDDEWYRVKAGLANSPNYATASWLRQNDTNGGAWAGTQQNAWSPALDDRTFYWDMGGVSHWTGTRQAPSVTAIGAGIGIGLTNIVQNVVNGAVNNGIATYQMDSSTSTNGWGYLGWDAYSTAVGRQPYVVVKYITKKYLSPYPGGAEWAFVASTDDFQPANQEAYEDTFAAHGGKYTMYGAANQVGTLGRMTMAQLLTLHAGGNIEIGPHSVNHYTPAGLLYHQPADTSAAEMDSLYRDVRSVWLHNQAFAVDGDYRYDDPYFSKSFALPQNTWSPEALLAIANTGYLTMRSGLMTFSPSLGKYYTLPNQGTARTDSLKSGVPWHRQREPRNMLGLPPTLAVQNIVGAKANATADLDSIRHNMRKLANQIIGQGRGELVLFWHDFKTDPNEAGYTEGVDGDDLGAMLDVVDELGGAYMRASELGRWRRTGGQAIDTPPAYAQEDTFRFEAVDQIWYLPDGMDSRHIRGLRDKALALSYDDTPPAAPSGLTANGFDDYVLLEWDASPAKETVTYSVHRYFDGSPDTVVVASKVGDTYYLASAVNGTEHFYFVSAVDNSDNESYDSSPASAVPSGTLALQYPAYFAMYYHDPAASAASSAQLDSLGEFDAVVFGPHAFEGDANEPFYEGMSAALKSRNTNIVLLNYTMAMTPRDDWASYPAGAPQRRSWDYIASIADSAGFGKNVAGYVTTSDAYPTKFVNVMLPATADTMARYFVDGLEDAGTDGTYSGFFIDLADSALYGWICYDGGCDDAMDYDQDGTEFSADAQEQAAYKAFQLEFVKGLRRELAEHGMGDRLIVGNGDFPRTNAQYAKYFDGFMWEGWNQYTPGPQGTEAAWEAAADAANLLVNAQTAPPLVLWHAKVDSSHAFITEPIAVGANGFAHVANAGDTNGLNSIPAMVRRLPNPGAMTTATDFSADTLRVSMSAYDLFLDLNHTAADTFTVWPYLVIDGADTLSVGGGWLRYIAPPQEFDGFEVEDGNNILSWIESDRAVSYNIYRGATGATTLYDEGITGTGYSDASTPHDSSMIYYAVAAVDSAGNISPKSSEVGLSSTTYTTPVITQFDILYFDEEQDGTITFSLDWTASKAVGSKLTTWGNNNTEPADTSAGVWAVGGWSTGTGGGGYQSASDVLWPSSDADSTFIVEWNRATPIPSTGYIVQGQRNNSGTWVTLGDTLALGPTDSTLTVDTDTGDLDGSEIRGKWLVRAYAVSAGMFSGVTVADSSLYNDAAEVHGRLKVWDGTTYVTSADTSAIIINYSEAP